MTAFIYYKHIYYHEDRYFKAAAEKAKTYS